MKIGLSVKIDVTKIDKSRLFSGQKGTYLDLTTFIDIDNPDEYNNNGFITQSQTKEERDAGEKLPILGNVKVFYKDGQAVNSTPSAATSAATSATTEDNFLDDDILF